MSTEVLYVSGSAIVFGVGVVAVLDPAIANIALAAIGAIVAITTVVFTYKTNALNKKQLESEKKLEAHDAKIEGVIKTSDGIKSELVAATKIASRAEGIIAGMAQAKGEAAIVAAAKAEGKGEQAHMNGRAPAPVVQGSLVAPADSDQIKDANTQAVQDNTVAVKENTATKP